MANHNIDIIISTERTIQNLNNLNNSLTQAQRDTIAAAKAANTLTVSNEAVARANLNMAKSQLKIIANDVAMLESRRKLFADQVIQNKALLDNAKNTAESESAQKRLASSINSLNRVTDEYNKAIKDLDISQKKYNNANQPFIDAEKRKAEAIRRATDDARRYAETLRQGSAENKRNEQQARQQQQAIAKAKQSNDQYIQSLRNQLEVSKRGGVEGRVYQNQLNLNTRATRAQRDEVEKLTRELDKLNNKQKQAPSTGGGMSLGGLAAGAGIAFGASQILQWGKDALTTADAMAALQVRIRATTKTQEEANAVFGQLTGVANTMGVSLENTISTYARFAPYASKLGANQQDVVQFIETLNKLGQVGGTSAQEVESALYQLSQSFAANKFQGQEFMVVSKAMPRVLDELADRMGVTRGELSRLASEGQIGAKELLLLKDSSEELETAFKNLPRSIEQASQGLTNQLAVAIDLINQKFGITASIAAQMDGWANTVGRFNQHMSGSWSEVDELNKQLVILNNQREKDLDYLKNAGTNSFKLNFANKALLNTEKQILEIKQKIAEAEKKASTTEAERPQAIIERDPQADIQIAKMKERIELEKLSGEARAKLSAIQKLGANATKEQVEEAEKLAKTLYELEQQTKSNNESTKQSANEQKRLAKELERNQKANEKYITELKAKAESDKLEVDTARSVLQYRSKLGDSVEDMTFKYRHLANIRAMDEIAAKQLEAQSKLNKDATDAERQKVDELTESLVRQQMTKQVMSDVGQMQGQLETELGDPFEVELQKINDQEAERLAVIEQYRQLDKEYELQYQQDKSDIVASAAKQREQLTFNETKSTLSASANMLGGFSQLVAQFQNESGEKNKAVFAVAKAFAIASAGLNFSSALMQAMADPSAITLPQKLANYGMVASAGAGLIASIKSQNFADGGFVSGAGTGRSDDIFANLSNGEFIATSKATERYRPELEAMNRGTYTGGNNKPVNIEIINNTGTSVRTEQLTEDDVRVIIGEEVPNLIGNELQDPYSPAFKSMQSSFEVSRNV